MYQHGTWKNRTYQQLQFLVKREKRATHGTFPGIPFTKSPFILGSLFSKKALKPSFLSSFSYNSHMSSLSNKWAPSALPGPRHIISRIRYVLTVDVCVAICSPIVSAWGRTSSGEGRRAWKRGLRLGEEAGRTEPVVVR